MLGLNRVNKWIKRTFYQGASRTPANRDFNNAGNQTFEATATADRPVLRARARWMSVNSALMNNIDESILNLAIGTGIKIQMQLDDKDKNTEIEDAFDRWCKENDWYESQRIILRTRMVDGEIFVYLQPRQEGLRYQLIEADALDDSQMDGGIIRDSDDIPVSYRFKTVDSYGNYGASTVTIPAEYIWHGFKKTRASQQRGVSEYSQAMTITKNLDAFNQATVQSARARASIAYVVEADGQIQGLDIETDPTTDESVQYIGDVAVHYLKKGETISKTAPGTTDTEFSKFNEVTIHQICTARNISYELGISDASKTNYSSFRASLQKDMKRIQTDQSWLGKIDDLIFYNWMEVEILSGRMKGVSYPKFLAEPWLYTKKSYITPEIITVDPLKERLAEKEAVKLNRTTQSILAHKAGYDFEDIIKLKAAEAEIMAENDMGIDPETGEVASLASITQNSDTASAAKQTAYAEEDRAMELLRELADAGNDKAITAVALLDD